MGRAALLATALLVSGLAASAAWTPVAAQQTAPEEQPDSARMRIIERLRRLARPPGADSVIYTEDSLQLAAAAAGNRPAAAQGMDSVALTLVGMPGYSLTEYSGGSADFEAQDRVLTLRAADGERATVVQEGNQIQADSSITFDQTTGRVRPRGMTTFTPPEGDAVDSPEMIYDLNQGRGTALDARTSYTQAGARWLVHGDMPYAAQDSSFMSHAQFTSCDLEVPHYHFETDEIKIVGGSVLVATGVRLYFADVPVFWLPFIAQSLSSGRSSGLLTPRFSVNDIVRTSTGYHRRISNIGFYWAMSDYSDALIAADWFSDNYFSLTSSAQYRINRLFLNGDVNVRNYWQTNGSSQFALDTRHAWKLDERTDLRVSARYAQSNNFVRENSFNPREVTQSIDSEGGFNRRFDWGALSVSANRKQYLSDDRTEWTLPSANLSLSPITLFRTAPAEAHFWNNMTWAGSGNFTRSTVDRKPPDLFSFGQASTLKNSGYVRSSLNLGNLGLSQSVNISQSQTRDVPVALLIPGVTEAPPQLVLPGSPARDIAQSTLSWSASVNYQQRLIGSTTLTPHVAFSGQMFRADTSSLAQSFVSAPSRVSVGAQLKTDIYGFFPGFGGFEAIRHKLSPSFDYQWSPEKTPNALQRQVFGSRVLQPQNTLSLTLNQTFEAKRKESEDEEASTAPDSTLAADSLALPPMPTSRGGEPRRLPQPDIVNLLSLRTSVVRYDFVEADSAGSFLQGFQTTVLSNQISSDLLRGLSISTDHELFDDKIGEDGKIASRRFAPHLSQVNLSFSLGSSSSIFRWLGLFGAGGDETAQEPAPATDPFAEPGATDESTVIPTGPAIPPAQRRPAPGSTGTWTANFSYSLQRPRTSDTVSQMLQATLRLQPTLNWQLSWRTAYDLEANAFNDHSIQLTRDLHRWQATFDFLQTATGNWSFRFEVSLTDNRDLKFDYDQQSLDFNN